MHRHANLAFDPRLDTMLRRLIGCGALAVLLLPAARGSSDWLGWMPLWLVAMPLSAWWALHRFALPLPRSALPARAASVPRRRRGMQARRRPPARAAFARAA